MIERLITKATYLLIATCFLAGSLVLADTVSRNDAQTASIVSCHADIPSGAWQVSEAALRPAAFRRMK